MKRAVVSLPFVLLSTALLGCPTVEPEPEPVGDPPLAPLVEPEPVAVDEWRVGFLDDLGDDVVRAAIEDGTFSWPSSGNDAQGTTWFDIEPNESGLVGGFTVQYFYAVADLDDSLSAGDRIIARTSGAQALYVGDVLQPGYFYGDSRPRVPLIPRADDDLVVVRGFGYRDTNVQLWSTPDELWMNQGDLTAPQLGLGETGEHWLGVPVLNMLRRYVPDVQARVIENDDFEATTTDYPSLAPASATQLGFLLRPKHAPTDVEVPMVATLRVVAPSLEFSYEREVEIGVIDPVEGRWQTFRSPIDGSVQGFGVLRPADFDPDREDYALLLSTHGAGVQGGGQARAYGAKDWAYIVAPTNRHPFGFDWEEWGRFNGLATLDHAMERYSIDPTRVYLGGHSMGGHGAWHLSVTTPGRFATTSPSAGWESFYSYGGSSHPTGPLARARAHSDTLNYISNLARRGAYVIHGTADDNVPFSEGQAMYDAVSAVTDDALYHWEEGAGHWWDNDPDVPGAACVDWAPMFEWAAEHTLDPFELEFDFISPTPSYSPYHSYVTIESAETAYEDVDIHSVVDGDIVTLTTGNVRSLTLDGDALLDKGVSTVSVDGEDITVVAGPLSVGPTDGKNHEVYGPYNQVYRRPFCFAYATDDPVYVDYVSYLVSYWATLGNGRACAVPLGELTAALREDYNIIYVGAHDDDLETDVPWDWNDDEVDIGPISWTEAGVLFVFPADGHLNAVIDATEENRHALYRVNTFNSRSGLPDYYVWGGNGAMRVGGFFTPDWEFVLGE